jgi:hypothetical protein
MRKKIMILAVAFAVLAAGVVLAAYQHEGEQDAGRWLSVYPDKAGTKLDHCSLCHTGGSYTDAGRTTTLGSCQWCHYTYGYDGHGNIVDTLNHYGIDYFANGRNAAAVTAIENTDSDGDGYTNIAEIEANRYPGDADDDPSKVVAPYRVYTKAQLEAMAQHTQFLLMNASRQIDNYAEYSGVPMQSLLQDAGMLSSATGVSVYAPDGYSTDYSLDQDTNPNVYHVNGTYPYSVYYYDEQADTALNAVDGWCDYSAPSCQGRHAGDPITNQGGLKMILAIKRDGAYLTPGVLGTDNKLNGEGPFRVVPPQKNPNAPDQSSRAQNQSVVWPYNSNWDHNAGFSARSVTMIKVKPLPAGTTDFDPYEAGWNYIDDEKVVVYGSIGNPGYTYNYYIPYFVADATHWTGLGLRNCSTSLNALVLAVIYDQSGAVIATIEKTLAAGGQDAFVVGSGLVAEGWIKVSSDQPLAGICLTGLSGSTGQLAGCSLVSSLATGLVLPHVAQNAAYGTTISVCNPHSSANAVTVTLKTATGTTASTQSVTIPANGAVDYSVGDMLQGGTQSHGSVELSAAQSVAAVGVILGTNGFLSINTAPLSGQ